MTPVFVFDIETIPDCALGRKILGLSNDLSDEEVANALFSWRMQTHESSFLPHYLQKIVAISCVLRTSDQLKIWSLGDLDSPESDLISRFFNGIDRFKPNLVSWNGSGFDLPVLHYRALQAGVSAPLYWELGEELTHFRYNNYLSRYHTRHIDLMDILAAYQARATAPLDHIAMSLGLPGKMGMSGDKVWSAYQAGQLEAIRDYCETDVLNTYLVYVAFQKMRGQLTAVEVENEHAKVREVLMKSEKPSWQAFLNAWTEGEVHV